MAHSESGPDQRTEVAPPAEPATRGRRNGFLVLVASGVVLATAFGGVAQFVTSSQAAPGAIGGNDNTGSQPVVPQSTVPATHTQTESSTTPASSSSATSSSSSSRATSTRPSSSSKKTVTTQPSRTTVETTPSPTTSNTPPPPPPPPPATSTTPPPTSPSNGAGTN